MTPDLVIGIDIGTSGARAVAMNRGGAVLAQGGARMSSHGDNGRSPEVWRRTMEEALDGLFAQIDAGRVSAISVDATSGTLLPVDRHGAPLADAMMYNDPVEDVHILASIAAATPSTSAVHGPTSGLAKIIHFQRALSPWKVVHQADWIAGLFSGRFDLSDENNALKSGYDPIDRRWPDWIAETGADGRLLPQVFAPGTVVGPISAEAAGRFGLSPDTVVVAGTTDGCASFLATGASEPGDGVTALGTSLTVKMLSLEPIFAPQYGLYSHRVGDAWLAGGASNTGGKVLLSLFPAERIAELSRDIDPADPTGLDYYPLLGKGERFPISDPDLAPRLAPRPAADARFLQGIFEGIAAIEALAYTRMAELGGPKLRSLCSVGGGARNAAWTEIRRRRLGVPLAVALSEEAAAGVARLALQGAISGGLL